MVGINVIGYVSAHCGLGAAARNTIGILTEKGHPVAVADIVLSENRSGKDHTFDHLKAPEVSPLPHKVHLFHCNPPVVGQIGKKIPAWAGLVSDLRAVVPFWELPCLPDFWATDLQSMDTILCPSRFIEQTVASAVLDPVPRIRHFPQTAFLPALHRPDRLRFGLPENGVCYAVSFDLSSDMERKNPWAAIDAFNRAFTDHHDAWLVIKINAEYFPHDLRMMLGRLRDYASANRRIIIIDRSMDYGEVVSLYESCDVLVSLHRSEGLGLALMEAMLLEKTVIATGWSGNMDFMSDSNSCLIGYRLVPVRSPTYRGMVGERTVSWAEPDIAEAAWWMRRLYDHPELRREKGRLARQDMLRRHEECLRGAVFSLLEEQYRIKKTRGESGAPVAAAMSGNPVPVTDQAELFRTVSVLMKSGEAAMALAVYYRSRSLLPETPEMLRFDEVMQRLRETAAGGVC
ncbi:MAG: glycosyltransferase family 4 protein [Chitinispirillaceae bacterium]|nr:glycosyltransferase family 4 protein [Chitinispirillaceae bacterium]